MIRSLRSRIILGAWLCMGCVCIPALQALMLPEGPLPPRPRLLWQGEDLKRMREQVESKQLRCNRYGVQVGD